MFDIAATITNTVSKGLIMDDKVVLVTGANRGLGQAMAEGLTRLGATVVLGCRNSAYGEAARDVIRRATGNQHVGFCA